MKFALNLKIADKHPQNALIWRQTFQEFSNVEILEMRGRLLISHPKIDAVVLNSWMSHEHYGGQPIIGQSQILSTQGASGIAPWVVTLPPFPTHGHFLLGKDGIQDWVNEEPDDDVRTYRSFLEIINTVVAFNQKHNSSIKTLGFSTDLLNFGKDISHEALMVRQAYIEVLQLV